jgi:hypothetical protein
VELFRLLGHLLEEWTGDLLRITISRELDGSPSGVDQHGDGVEAPWWGVHKAVGYERDPE